MTTFNEREQGFEKKFAHDAEMQFKAQARRNKLFGIWAAETLGKSGADADAYAKSVVEIGLKQQKDAGVLQKVMDDLRASGISVPEDEIAQKMAELLSVAKAQLVQES
jgi:hypothetical protein